MMKVNRVTAATSPTGTPATRLAAARAKGGATQTKARRLTSSSCTRPPNDRGCKEGRRHARQYQVLVEQMR
jgi:hypothetical protein